MEICNNPDVLSIFYIITTFVEIAMFAAPVILIILIMIDLIKGIAGDPDKMKSTRKNIITRIIAVVILLLVPLTIEFSQNLMGETELEYLQCFTNANIDEINDIRYSLAEEALSLAESKQTRYYYDAASLLVAKITDSDDKDDFTNRLETLNNIITSIENDKLKPFTSEDLIFGNTGNVGGEGSLDVVGYGSDGKDYGCTSGGQLSSEPDPSQVINYWDSKGMLDADDYIYPAVNGELYGAWPANYKEYPSQLTNVKTYNGLSYPITSDYHGTEGKYQFVYQHNGIDFMSSIGTPVYSPVDGTLEYSEWGHTTYRGCDENAYSITINMDESVTFNGYTFDTVFLTHLSGIVFRCSRNECNQEIKAGQLIGFVGNAVGGFGGYAPHLHMTLYGGSYSSGLKSTVIENLYDITSGDIRMAGE